MTKLNDRPAQASRSMEVKPVHSESMHEIITKVPAWIIRWGISIFVGILIVLVITLTTVTYPDTISAKWHVEFNENPIRVTSVDASLIHILRVHQHEFVVKGESLASIDTEGNAPSAIELTAPCSGVVSFADIMHPGKFLNKGDVILTIHSKNENPYFTIEIPPSYISQIKYGQKVLFGISTPLGTQLVSGTIYFIAEEPTASGFFAAHVLMNPKDQKTCKILKSWMHGECRIIIDNTSLVKRLFRNLFGKLNFS